MGIRTVLLVPILFVGALVVAQSNRERTSPSVLPVQERVIRTAQQDAFKTSSVLPDCYTYAVERGDPEAGPSVTYSKLAAGCKVPWHTHSAVFFCRPGRMSRRAELTGSFVGAGVVCAAADAASNSKAGITRVVFIYPHLFWVNRADCRSRNFPDISLQALQPLGTRLTISFQNNFTKQFIAQNFSVFIPAHSGLVLTLGATDYFLGHFFFLDAFI